MELAKLHWNICKGVEDTASAIRNYCLHAVTHPLDELYPLGVLFHCFFGYHLDMQYCTIQAVLEGHYSNVAEIGGVHHNISHNLPPLGCPWHSLVNMTLYCPRRTMVLLSKLLAPA